MVSLLIDCYEDIQLDLTKKRVLGLLDEIEQQFDIVLTADPFKPSFEDHLISWKCES